MQTVTGMPFARKLSSAVIASAARAQSTSSSSSSSSSARSNPSPAHPDPHHHINQRVIQAIAYGGLDPFPLDERTPQRYISTYSDQHYRASPRRGMRREVEVQPVGPSGVAHTWRGGRMPSGPAVKGRRTLATTSRPVKHELRRKLVEQTDEWADDRGKGKGREAVQEPYQPPGKLVPGCWVETRTHGTPREGIYLGPSTERGRSLVLLRGGTIEAVGDDDITFVLPDLTSPAAAAECLLAEEGSLAAHDLTQELRKLEARVEHATRLLVANGANGLYDLLARTAGRGGEGKADGSSSSRQHATTHDSLRALRLVGPLNTLSPVGRQLARATPAEARVLHLAMHRLLMDDPEHFLADPVSHRTSGKFTVRDSEEVARFETVRGWLRDGSDEMSGFARRAAKAREWGRLHPALYEETIAGGNLRLHTLPAGMEWTPSDLVVLDFFRRALEQQRLIQPQPYMALAPSILKRVDTVTEAIAGAVVERHAEFDALRVREFLAEVGAVAPWENWVAHEADGMLMRWEACDPERPPPAAKSAPQQHPAPSPARPASQARTTYSSDLHDAVRKDFGLLPVYTIDDPGAKELDDGISLEAAPPTPSGAPSWWIHVHVADPTTLLHPGHQISALARERDHTEYFPEKTWAMLPGWFVEDEGFSLGSRDGGEQKVLTFSTRVDARGEVLETDVKASVVRTVRRLTYGAVNSVLGYEAPPPPLVLTEPLLPAAWDSKLDAVNPAWLSPRTRRTDDALLATDPVALSDLGTLRTLAAAMLKRRADDNALYWNVPRAEVTVSPTLSHHFYNPPAPLFYATSPLVSIRLPPGEDVAWQTPAQLLVSECMVTANRTAARFCVERGISVPFRAQSAPTAREADIETVLALRDPNTGEARGRDVIKYGVDYTSATTSVDPGHHWPMGIKDDYGYVKVTSPLRRYSDMFAHWQIKAALLPSSAVGSTAPFSRKAVIVAIDSFDLVQKTRGRIGRSADAFWTSYVLRSKFRGLTFSRGSGDADPVAAALLRNLSGIAMREATFTIHDAVWTQPILIPELGVRGQLRTRTAEEALALGEEGRIRVADILLGSRARVIAERAA